MKKERKRKSYRLILLGMICFLASAAYGQSGGQDIYKPVFAAKTNLLYWGTTTPNLGFEIGLSKKYTLDISGGYNPWTFSDNKKLKHVLVQPELRYWTCERFNGHFFGLHAHYAHFNISDIKWLGTEDYRYQGNLYGGGFSYGYHWVLSNRWSLEATIGLGYAYIDYGKYDCGNCGEKIKDSHRNYWGPTKAGINLIYIIK